MRIMRLYIKVAEASLQGTSGMEKGTNPMPEMPHRGRTRQRNMGARKQEENQVRDMQPMVSTDTNGKEQDLLEELPIGIGEAKRYVAVASQRNPRLKALGNAIVPQVAEEIMKAIKEMP
jgi:site-specific DNA-cytosine methylase